MIPRAVRVQTVSVSHVFLRDIAANYEERTNTNLPFQESKAKAKEVRTEEDKKEDEGFGEEDEGEKMDTTEKGEKEKEVEGEEGEVDVKQKFTDVSIFKIFQMILVADFKRMQGQEKQHFNSIFPLNKVKKI